MAKKSTSTTTVPSLKSLALDAIGAIALDLQKADPTMSREQSVAKAAQTPEGKSAYALYQRPGSELPWPTAVRHDQGDVPRMRRLAELWLHATVLIPGGATLKPGIVLAMFARIS